MPRTAPLTRPGFSLPVLRLGSVLNWLVAADQAYRDHVHLTRLNEGLLRDAGLTRLSNGRITRQRSESPKI